MNSKFTCEQVMSLINYYIEGKLNPVLRQYVDSHIAQCSACAQKFSELKEVYLRYGSYNQSDNGDVSQEAQDSDKELLKNLSAYIDNELNIVDNIRIKKITVSNPNARKKLETMYNFQKLLHSAYSKTKNDIKADYSKNIISVITNLPEDYTTTFFNKLIILFIILLSFIAAGVFYLYF